MKVCLIAEGCYPYITGGVSGWIHQLISGLPDVEFSVVSIMPSLSEDLKYRYELPGNLTELKTVFLDHYLTLKHLKMSKARLARYEQESLNKFLQMDTSVDWEEIINMIRNPRKIGNVTSFLQSEFFWNAVVSLYSKKYENESFNNFFWTIRTMLLPLMHLLQSTIPEADIYHSVSTGYAGLLGVCFSCIAEKPFLLTEHGIYAREREEEIIKAGWVSGIYKNLWIEFFYFISTAAYKMADRIVALFKRNMYIQRELGAPAELTRVISNGIDLKNFQIEKKEHEGLKVGAVLRIVPIKDVMTMIRSFKLVKERLERVELFLIGPVNEDPEYYQQCLSLVKLLGLEEYVIFTGRTDPREYYREMDLIVLTSVSEGQPFVLLEAMAAGIPVVATDVGSCRELLEGDKYEGSCGAVTGMVSPEETAAWLIKLLNNPMLREEMGRNGKARVQRAYNQDMFLQQYKAVYDEIG